MGGPTTVTMGTCHSNVDDLTALESEMDADKRKKLYDQLWESYDKDKSNSLEKVEIKPLLVDMTAACIKTVEDIKKKTKEDMAVQEAELKKQMKAAPMAGMMAMGLAAL